MCITDGDNSVLNLLEKSIEPVDETSFVSSILNSGKVIQLTGRNLFYFGAESSNNIIKICFYL